MGTTMGKGGGHFLDALPSQGALHVVMLGLDSAGKTTALYRLKFDQYLNTVPTIGFNCEKVQGTVGKAKGVQFLVWDVGGQEKLRPLWRSYTRCTDGILFVVDSVDVERMEEAKMELMRTAKCPDNQGVPVLILANKQDLPGAREPKELEKLLGLHELVSPMLHFSVIGCASSSTGNIVGSSSSASGGSGSSSYAKMYGRSSTPTTQHNKSFGCDVSISHSSITKDLNIPLPTFSTSLNSYSSSFLADTYSSVQLSQQSSAMQKTTTKNSDASTFLSSSSPLVTAPIVTPSASLLPFKQLTSSATTTNLSSTLQYKGWYIQPACAITGEGLQEGLEALYEMILKRRKLHKVHRKKR